MVEYKIALKIEGVDYILLTSGSLQRRYRKCIFRFKKSENSFTNTINYDVSLVGKF